MVSVACWGAGTAGAAAGESGESVGGADCAAHVPAAKSIASERVLSFLLSEKKTEKKPPLLAVISTSCEAH
jgi:hypothetical protein